MAINYSYPAIGALATGDLLTVVDISKGNRTNTLKIGDLSSYIITTSSLINGSGTANVIPKWSDADTLTDSVMSETASGISLTGDLAISTDISVTRNSTFSGSVDLGDSATDAVRQNGTLELLGPVKDSTGVIGNTEQVLVSNAQGKLVWENYQGSGLEYQAAWNASTNVPDLTSITLDDSNTGKYWVVSTAGNTDLGGITDWNPGDWAIVSQDSAGTVFWDHIDGSSVDGAGDTNTLAVWTSEKTLGTAPITINGDETEFAGNILLDADLDIGFEVGGRVYGDDYLNLEASGSSIVVDGSDSALLFKIGNSTAVTINDNQDVGIGTTTPSQKLHVDGNARVTGAYYDSVNTPGAVNQVLTSTATGTSWVDPGTITVEAATLVVIACKNTSGATITKGTPVYQTGNVGATATIEIAPADALISANKLPAIGVLETDLNNNELGNVVITGELTNFTTDPIDGLTPTVGDKIFVKSGGGLTLTKPTGEGNGIQNMGLVGKVSGGNSGSITVSSIMRTNDVPNLPEGRIWVGDGNTIVSDTVFLDETNGRMGIGTTTPNAKLQVIGDARISGDVISGNNIIADNISVSTDIIAGLDITADYNISAGGDVSGNNFYVSNSIVHRDDSNTSIQFPQPDTIRLTTGGNEKIVVTPSSTSLRDSATITGSGNNNYLTIAPTANYAQINSNASIRFSVDGDNKFTIQDNGVIRINSIGVSAATANLVCPGSFQVGNSMSNNPANQTGLTEADAGTMTYHEGANRSRLFMVMKTGTNPDVYEQVVIKDNVY